MASKTTPPTIFCRHCGYNLHALPRNQCPECGRPFDPNNPKTYSKRRGSPWRRRWIKRIVVSVTTIVLLFGVGAFSLWWPWHREQAAIRLIRWWGDGLETKTVGPKWLQTLLGRRGGFLLERVDTAMLGLHYYVTDAELASLDKFSELRMLSLSNSSVTDAEMPHLRNLTALQELFLGDHVTDAGLVNLKNMKELQTLSLGEFVTDKGLEHLKNLKGLKWLCLDKTQVTDAGLENLNDMTELRQLWLNRTQITDAGLKHLKNLKRLRSL